MEVALPNPAYSIAAPLPSVLASQPATQAAAVDLGAGPEGVPTLLTWKNEDEPAGKVFVTGTFAKGWRTKIEMRKKE